MWALGPRSADLGVVHPWMDRVVPIWSQAAPWLTARRWSECPLRRERAWVRFRVSPTALVWLLTCCFLPLGLAAPGRMSGLVLLNAALILDCDKPDVSPALPGVEGPTRVSVRC